MMIGYMVVDCDGNRGGERLVKVSAPVGDAR